MAVDNEWKIVILFFAVLVIVFCLSFGVQFYYLVLE